MSNMLGRARLPTVSSGARNQKGSHGSSSGGLWNPQTISGLRSGPPISVAAGRTTRRCGPHYTDDGRSISPHSDPTSQRTTRTGSRDHRRTACLAARRHCCCCCDGCDICLQKAPHDGATVAKRLRHRSVVCDVGPDSRLKGGRRNGGPLAHFDVFVSRPVPPQFSFALSLICRERREALTLHFRAAAFSPTHATVGGGRRTIFAR